MLNTKTPQPPIGSQGVQLLTNEKLDVLKK